MKKLFILLAVVSFGLFSCSTEKNNGLGEFDFDTALLFGTWEVTEINDLPWVMEKTTFTFDKDGSYASKGHFGNVEGAYKLSGKTIKSTVKGIPYMNYDVHSLSSNTFVFGLVETGQMVKITCKK